MNIMTKRLNNRSMNLQLGCLTHKILIGSQVNLNKGIYFNLSTHIVTYTSLLSTSSIEAYKFVKIK